MSIPIYNPNGELVASLRTSTELEHVSGRTSRAGRYYYKGVGAPYKGHLTIYRHEEGVVGKSEIFYCGYHAINPKFKGKFGIFQRRFQPYFSDFIGSCGVKELKVLSNSIEFPLSAVKVVDYREYDHKNHQYYFVLDYKSGRSDYIEGNGNPEALLNLLCYMAKRGWCFPWDKTSIRDIDANGMVHDVADLFRSEKRENIFGSVYSAFYSLYRLLTLKYNEVTTLPPIFAVVVLLNKLGIKIEDSRAEDYYIEKYLLPGRNCAHVENVQWGDKVKAGYIKRFKVRREQNQED